MREIKFKGKRKDNEKWVYGCYVYDEYQAYIIEYGENIKYEVDPETVSEYMGLKDRTNKRIYEGDRLHHHGHNVYSTMKWIKKYACFAGVEDETLYFYYYQEVDSKDLEIVGNIYDNPELKEANNE